MKYLTNCWWKSLVGFLIDHEIKIHTGIEDTKPTFHNDKRIMDEIMKFLWSSTEARIINECQMKLKAVFISDIVLLDGEMLQKWAWSGSGDTCINNISWPRQAHLTSRHWMIWQKALKKTFLRNDIN